jgi:hypothetical protein
LSALSKSIRPGISTIIGWCCAHSPASRNRSRSPKRASRSRGARHGTAMCLAGLATMRTRSSISSRYFVRTRAI